MITPDEANAISEMADKQRRDKRRLFFDDLRTSDKVHKRVSDAIEKAASYGKHQVELSLAGIVGMPGLTNKYDEVVGLGVIAKWVNELGYKTQIQQSQWTQATLLIFW